ncbi:hypothetical protein N8E89_19450 (plasmid) [Phyllobacterium sp. A18/5-2]|uniref:hypothetical protein n=1 Tax=Phyllobacterium sp. A18/5-2 TaxID=2978392 RepID=UPI0021C86254|nr:hypothetical protein [Phyllobacterium sp. A18/5-2]UXN66779.1 hypothetical protein N8E89_19450 [Phyllobacterium sp. A18/5-2]
MRSVQIEHRLSAALCVAGSGSPEILKGHAQRRIGDTNEAEIRMLGRVAVEVTLQSSIHERPWVGQKVLCIAPEFFSD